MAGAEPAQCEVRFERPVVCFEAEGDGHSIYSLFQMLKMNGCIYPKPKHLRLSV